MIIKAYQTGFHREGPVKIRPVAVPDGDYSNDDLLEETFRLGQNMFQPLDGFYSVSVGDVVELPDGSLHCCAPSGWLQLEAGVDPTSLVGGDILSKASQLSAPAGKD